MIVTVTHVTLGKRHVTANGGVPAKAGTHAGSARTANVAESAGSTNDGRGGTGSARVGMACALERVMTTTLSSTSDRATDRARLKFMARVAALGGDPIDEETAILSVGRASLPSSAIAVLDGGEGDAGYWEWLLAQTNLAATEQAAAYAGGHEWHGGAT